VLVPVLLAKQQGRVQFKSLLREPPPHQGGIIIIIIIIIIVVIIVVIDDNDEDDNDEDDNFLATCSASVSNMAKDKSSACV